MGNHVLFSIIAPGTLFIETSVGIVQQNILPNCRLADQKDLMKATILRCIYEETISHHYGVGFSTPMWKNNKAATYVSSQTVDNICRCDKRVKQKINISCSKLVQEYNVLKGGVELTDVYLGRSRM